MGTFQEQLTWKPVSLNMNVLIDGRVPKVCS